MAKKDKNKGKPVFTPVAEGDKEKALKAALAKIEEDFGKGAVMRLGDNPDPSIQTIPTGCLSLDVALGVGGLPKGRIVEIFGPESSGKTTVALHAVAEVQKHGGSAAFVDAEHALDPVYAQKLGVNIDSLIVSQPDHGEQALEITEALVRSGAIDIIVVDSVAALVPRVEIDGDMGASNPGGQARLMSQALRKITGVINKSSTVVIFINQLRDKIGVIYGSPETTTGGRALKFFSSIRIDVRRKEPIKDKDGQIGAVTLLKVVKNKMAPPFKEITVDMIFGQGISQAACILDLATDLKIVSKAGAWYSYGDTRLGQGRDKARDFLVENPELMKEIEMKVREHHGLLKESTETKTENNSKSDKKKTNKSLSEEKEASEAFSEDVDDLLDDLLDLDGDEL